MRPTLAVVSVLSCAACSHAATTSASASLPGWSAVVLDERARAELPGAAERSASSVDTEAGRVDHTVFLWESGDGSFAASHWTLPQRRLAEGTTVESVLEGSRDGVLRSLSGTLVREQWTTVEGCPALDVTLQIEGEPRPARSRLILCGLDGYQLMAVGRSDEDQRRFVESFERLAPVEGPTLPRRESPGRTR